MYEQLERELEAYGGGAGLRPSDLLSLPDGLRRLMTWLGRVQSASLDELAAELGCEPDSARALADRMVERGLLLVEENSPGSRRYKMRLAPVSPRSTRGPSEN